MAEAGKHGKLRIFKNNVDSFGNTYGAHENYLVTPHAMENIRFLVPFLVSRQIFSGAGKVAVGSTPGESSYQLTQRADFIDRIFSDRTSQVRGIINLRKREIPKHGQNLRLHLLVGDSNMSEYALGLRVGTTALVLRLLEEDSSEDFPARHLSSSQCHVSVNFVTFSRAAVSSAFNGSSSLISSLLTMRRCLSKG